MVCSQWVINVSGMFFCTFGTVKILQSDVKKYFIFMDTSFKFLCAKTASS